ncbi:MAG TPA: hypothetical protein VFP22_02895 [Candidatus Limnocylindrales bacterium]|nr:hypothetical protein [Candidatus Limnocylindrales bacterium]
MPEVRLEFDLRDVVRLEPEQEVPINLRDLEVVEVYVVVRRDRHAVIPISVRADGRGKLIIERKP